MAVIDSDAGEIVIRLVYDGPPEAGKTTSLRALAGSLVQPAYTPAEDDNGRTLWFDWMEYVGGRFEGSRIRCQIVSVPGQRELSARRRRVIDGADVVVFVGDSSARETARTLGYLFELRDMLAGASDAPVGVILQANKRDLPDAIPLDQLHARLAEGGWPIGVVESIAADGTGIREAFVYAVRLALDRTRELMSRGALRTTPSGRRGAAELLDALRADDRALYAAPPPVIASGPASPAAELLREVLAHETDERVAAALPGLGPTRGAPAPPDASVPSGAIWPPVEGRMVLHEATEVGLAVRRVGDGDWMAGTGSGWRAHSTAAAEFSRFDDGRQALVAWAQGHAALAGLLSPPRCIVLADTGAGTWRLWQIVKLLPSLRAWLVDGAALTASELLGRLTAAAACLGDAHRRCVGTQLLPTLDTIGRAAHGPQFISLIPGSLAIPLPHTSDIAGRVASALSRVLAVELAARRADLARWLEHVERAPGSWEDVVAAALAERRAPRVTDAASLGHKPPGR